MTDTAAEPIVDADVVDETTVGTDLVAAAPATGTTAMLMPLADPDAVKEAMQVYQRTLDATLDASDWQSAGGDRRFVKKSGWRKIAKAYGISVTILHQEKVRDADGLLLRAEAVVRATGPNGQVFDGDGYCSRDERQFGAKVENDLPATATTRAVNRAISSLVGFGEVSAEEVGDTGGGTELPVWAQPADAPLVKNAAGALGRLLDDATGETARGVYDSLTALFDGKLPVAVATALVVIDQRRTASRDNLEQIA